MSVTKINTHKFSSGQYSISVGKVSVQGYCANANDSSNEIFVAKGLKPTEMLETIVHESLHAEFRDKSEAQINKAAKNISRFLWRLGYRKTK